MLLLKVGLIITLPLLVLGAVVLKDGVVVVDVTKHAKDTRIFVPVPLSLVNMGVDLLPLHRLDENREELATCMPYVEAVSDQLMELPDVTFVEVTKPGEYVHLAKQGNKLVLDVNNSEEKVHVSIPIRGVKKVMQNLAEATE